MSEDQITIEIQPQRPRVEIESDLVLIDTEYKQLEEQEIEPLVKRLESLPDDQSKRIEEYVQSYPEGEINGAQIRQDFREGDADLVMELVTVFNKARAFESRRESTQSELTPYLMEEYFQLVEDLLSRLDYDALFRYYRTIETDGSRMEPTDLLSNTLAELHFLRHGAFEKQTLAQGDYYEYRSGVNTLTSYAEKWKNKGFLSDKPFEDRNIEIGEVEAIRQRRLTLVDQLGIELRNLDRFNQHIFTYQHTLVSKSVYDHHLSDIHRCLDTSQRVSMYYSEDFEITDFDPALLEAAERHIKLMLQEHRTQGRLPDNDESRLRERERINRLNGDSLIDLEVEGFEVGDGETRAVDPTEMIAEVKRLLPPDFTHGLRAFRRKPHADADAEESDTTETIGRFIPIYDENHRFTGADIEVYRPVL